MRIIAGEAKGRTLFAPDGAATRPTSDKIRGSIFNILSSRVFDARVLDLFGGTGALALEALSRGAESAVIVDTAPAAIRCIERNAHNVLKDRFDICVRIMKADYKSAVSQMPAGSPFDLIFLDPPYRLIQAYSDAVNRLLSAGLIAPDARIIAEHAKDARLELNEPFEIYDTRLYGETAVSFIRFGA